ncbi:MAG: hypothetical protein H6719_21250 [Sandaracinaceae bacterium]|nr:hypothetical protein [Sandaracinaceae bacterium]
MHRLLVRLVALALLLPSAPALAESGVPLIDAGPLCQPGGLVPADTNVPANLSAWRIHDVNVGRDGSPVVELYQRFGPMREARGLEVSSDDGIGPVVRPIEPLVAGGEYTLVIRTCEDEGEIVEHDFTVDPAYAAPASLGVTSLSELRATRPFPGGDLRYHVIVTLTLSDEARAVAPYHEQQLMVSRRAQRWRSPPLEDVSEEIVVQCRLNGDEPPIVTESFWHLARPIAGETNLRTDVVRIDDVPCADAVRVHPETGEPLTPEEIAEMDTMPDGGVMPPPPMDAGVPEAGATPMDGSMQPDVSGMEPVEGCTCRSAGAGGSPTAPGFLVLLGALARLRRR